MNTWQTTAHSAEDIAKVAEFAQAHDLVMVQSSSARRSVWLSGTVEKLSEAFGVELAEYDHPSGGTYRGRTGPIMIPSELEGIVVGVFGLDNRPQAKPHFRVRGPEQRVRPGAAAAPSASSQFTPIQVAKLYDFPANLDGTGQCIGIIELGRRLHDVGPQYLLLQFGIGFCSQASRAFPLTTRGTRRREA